MAKIFTINRVLKAQIGDGFWSTPAIIAEMMKKGEFSNDSENRNPDDSPWDRNRIYSYLYVTVENARAKAASTSNHFEGHSTALRIVVKDGKVTIKDGGHSTDLHKKMSYGAYKFPKCPRPDLYPELSELGGKTVAKILSDEYGVKLRNLYNEIMSAPIKLILVNDDPLIQMGLNNGKPMSQAEKTFAYVCKNETYKAIEAYYNVKSAEKSVHHNLEIGNNKNSNVRERANNVCWLFSTLAFHDIEKAGAAMEYVVKAYDADTVTSIYDEFMDIATMKEFSFLRVSGTDKIVLNCNRVHGLIKFARNRVVESYTRGGNSGVMIVRNCIGENTTKNPAHLEFRANLARDVVEYIKTETPKILKYQQLCDMNAIDNSGAGHVSGGNSFCEMLEEAMRGGI